MEQKYKDNLTVQEDLLNKILQKKKEQEKLRDLQINKEKIEIDKVNEKIKQDEMKVKNEKRQKMLALKEQLNQQKLERLNRNEMERNESKKPYHPHFPFGKKTSQVTSPAVEVADEEAIPDPEDIMLKELTDPRQIYNIPRQEKVFF
jgi:hypothetical protein